MPHLNDQALHAYRDHELPADQTAAATAHLAACPRCQEQLAALDARATRVETHLAALAPAPADAPISPSLALARFQTQRLAPDAERKESMWQSLFNRRWRPLWVGVSLVLILGLALSFAPVRTLASQVLSLFRIQQITVLPVDLQGLGNLSEDSPLSQQISQLMSKSTVTLKEPGPSQTVADAAAASALAGFPVRLFADRQPAELAVEDSAAFEMTLDRTRIQAVLEAAGRTDIQLPESIDGAKVSVNIPRGVTAAYGDCKGKSEERFAGWGGMRNCIVLAQIPSPTAETPPELNMTQLAEVGLQMAGMSSEAAQAFSQAVDWTSTLVVPVPNDAQTREVTVDGVKGYLVSRSWDSNDRLYTLLWVKDGIVYGLSGFGNPDDALTLAATLR